MAKTNRKQSSHHGSFSLPDGRTVFGEVLIEGQDTTLTLKDASKIGLGYGRQHIHGMSVDGHHITCVDCLHLGEGSTSQGRLTSHYTKLFPHLVVVGAVHLDPDAATVTSVSFTTSDLKTLFHDHDAFGLVVNAAAIMDVVLAENRKHRPIEVGEGPEVHYYTGKDPALDMDSAIGNLVVSYERRTRVGGVDGIQVKSDRRFQIKPSEPISLSDALDRIGVVRRFLSLAAGRPQKIIDVRIRTTSDTTQFSPLQVHWTYGPKGPRGDLHAPDSFDRPFDPIAHPDEFVEVFRNWIGRDDKMRIPRTRLLTCLRKTNRYDPDRLVAAANVFDLLPSEACPSVTPLPAEMVKFKDDALKLLKDRGFPKSPERDRALGDIGRLGKPSLTSKVLHRWTTASKDIPNMFPDIDYVLKQAVKCRNHFVHGPSDSFEYERAEPFIFLFTDALEFVFVFADLVEAGWNPTQWRGRHYSDGHMFSRFRMMYPENAARFKAAMEA
ncbi:HEPN domain-containing protein [Dyella sp. S184]|uniref:ApeA N-terminal domain 1-containing protein n=1 Tax=Dyella sp. S184 TaxID=1641862 RepID=UPI00131C0891|nr:HEPN domain-containing protein [Dyella sp. S184]